MDLSGVAANNSEGIVRVRIRPLSNVKAMEDQITVRSIPNAPRNDLLGAVPEHRIGVEINSAFVVIVAVADRKAFGRGLVEHLGHCPQRPAIVARIVTDGDLIRRACAAFVARANKGDLDVALRQRQRL